MKKLYTFINGPVFLAHPVLRADNSVLVNNNSRIFTPNSMQFIGTWFYFSNTYYKIQILARKRKDSLIFNIKVISPA